jgi:hypothetical protein
MSVSENPLALQGTLKMEAGESFKSCLWDRNTSPLCTAVLASEEAEHLRLAALLAIAVHGTDTLSLLELQA